jgi:hypothetical protein
VDAKLLRIGGDPSPLLSREPVARAVEVRAGPRGFYVRIMPPDGEPEELYVGGKGGLAFTLPANTGLWGRAKSREATVAIRVTEVPAAPEKEGGTCS